MKELKQDNDRYYYGDWEEMIDSFEVETVVRKDDNDYQGDSYLLFRDGDRYGILIFGWGSCSGCDAAQACGSVEEATQLRDDLWGDVRWGTKDETLEYLKSQDDKLQWYGHDETYAEFKAEAIEFLSN